jgi:hypothetical protein
MQTLYTSNPLIAAYLACFLPIDLEEKEGEKKYIVLTEKVEIIVTVKK